MARKVDALIIGAGPAGLAAGVVLARQGLRTVICEQHQFPVDKPCGEGVMPTGLADLERLGVKRHLDPEQASPFVGICYRSPRGKTAAATFAEGPGWGIRRTALSAAFLRRVQEIAGLELQQGVRAEPLARTTEGIQVQVGDSLILSRLLVGADGLSSRIRRWAGLEGSPQPLQRYGARQHFHIRPWSKYVEVHWQYGVEAYVTPCGDAQIGVSFLWDRARFHGVRGGKELIPSLLQAFPALEARLDGVSLASTPRAIGPLHRTALAPVSDGVLLIGDAAGYLDAITGEGVSLALAQALCLEKTIVPILQQTKAQRSLLQTQDLRAYARAYKAIVAPYYRVTRLVLFLSRHPQLATRVIQALGRSPEVFQHFLSANMGLVSPWSLGWQKTARFLTGMVTPSLSSQQ